MAFKYLPLDTLQDEIRLVRIQPGSRDEKLQCTIVHEQLERGLEYEALSYTWGDPLQHRPDQVNSAVEIVLNNQFSFNIQRNLASFMHHYRKQNNESNYIWIDALCINQEDTEERNTQVLRISEIYTEAKRVLIWLGPAADNSSEALQFLTHLKNSEASKNSSDTDFTTWNEAELKTLEWESTLEINTRRWKAVLSVFERTWWSRTWIAQEFILAQEPIFICGNETMDVSSLWQLLENLWIHSDWTSRVILEGTKLLTVSTPARTILWLRHIHRKRKPDLLQTVYRLRHTLSSDARDKIYGLLSLASDAELIVPCPDYFLAPIEIFLNAFEEMTSVRGDLDWLMLAGEVSKDSAYPSWYPDLPRKCSLVSMNTSRSVAKSPESGFCASASSQAIARFEIMPLECTVFGIVADFVDGLGAKQDTCKLRADETRIIQSKSQIIAYATDSDTYEALWRTVVADQDFEGTLNSWRAPSSFARIFSQKAAGALTQLEDNHEQDTQLNELTYFTSWIRGNRDFKIGGKTIEEWSHTILKVMEDQSSVPGTFGFDHRFYSTTNGRRLVISKNGYLGIAPERVQQKDYVCLLFGGRMPVILRPTEKIGTYHFVGECYIHGWMLGEMWESFNIGPESVKEFVLA